MQFKKLLGLGIMCGLLQCSTALASEPVTLVDTQNNKLINVEQMADSLVGYDAVFFGEYHDQPVLHEVELDLLKALYAKHGDKLVLSMEMFEADNQEILNQYLEGKVSEDNFLANSRPWPRYKTDYRGMIEFAKEHHIPVIAANIPRFMAKAMAKEGTVENIGWDYKQYLPEKTTAPEGAYRDKFFGYMSQGKNGAMKEITPRRLQGFAAQCLKDDKMAESIFNYLQEHPEKVVLHINGCFHSDRHLGTVERLQQRAPELKIAVISSKDMPGKVANPHNAYKENKGEGEFLVFFQRVENPDRPMMPTK